MPNSILDNNESKKNSLDEELIQSICACGVIIFSMHILVAFYDTDGFYKYMLKGIRVTDYRLLIPFLIIVQYVGGICLFTISSFLGWLIAHFFLGYRDIKRESILLVIFIISKIGILFLSAILWESVSYLITLNLHPQLLIFLLWTFPYCLGAIIWSMIFWGIVLAVSPLDS